jgi:type II secretory pathway component HofQ
MRTPLLVLATMLLAATPAAADRELCRPGAKYRGATLDLDVKEADIKDVFRLLAEVGDINLVVPDDVSGRVTLKLKHVPWDQVACTVARMHRLTITVQGSILIVERAKR